MQVCGAVYEDETSFGSSQVTPADYCKSLKSIFFFFTKFHFFQFSFLAISSFFFKPFYIVFFISFRPQMTEFQDSILPHAQKSLENCLALRNLVITDEFFLDDVCKVMYDWSHALSCSPKKQTFGQIAVDSVKKTVSVIVEIMGI